MNSDTKVKDNYPLLLGSGRGANREIEMLLS
jgi:hypothetical protein